MNDRQSEVRQYLKSLNIDFSEIRHPAVPTAEEASVYWQGYDCVFCKNLFFRDHRGKQHYLALFPHTGSMNISMLEKKLGRGKLTLASGWRLEKYLGLEAGSVSPFGLINDTENHVILLLDRFLEAAPCLGFHPNDNTATFMLTQAAFRRFLRACGNTHEYLDLL